MGARRGAALAACAVAAALAGSVSARADPFGPADEPDDGAPDGGCELSRADRAHTPARRCASCHDGTVADDAVTPGRNHPVGIDYAAARQRQPDQYSAALPPEVPLVDGRIACTTCHDGASQARGRIASPRGVASLCLACHRL